MNMTLFNRCGTPGWSRAGEHYNGNPLQFRRCFHASPSGWQSHLFLHYLRHVPHLRFGAAAFEPGLVLGGKQQHAVGAPNDGRPSLKQNVCFMGCRKAPLASWATVTKNGSRSPCPCQAAMLLPPSLPAGLTPAQSQPLDRFSVGGSLPGLVKVWHAW